MGLSRNENIIENILGASNTLGPAQSENEAILLAILNGDTYSLEGTSRIARLLIAICNGTEWSDPLPTRSRNEAILYSILNGEEYTGYYNENSRMEKLLVQWSAEAAGVETTVGPAAVVSIADALEKAAIAVLADIEAVQSGTPVIESTTKVPYLTRTTDTDGNVRYMDKIVGGTVAFNQLYETHSSYNIVGDDQNVTVTIDSDGYVSVSAAVTENTYILIRPATVTIPAEHIYLILCDNYSGFYWGRNGFTYTTNDYYINKHTASFGGLVRIYIGANESVSISNVRFSSYDLTQMFGSTIADYIYTLEQTTTGAGVAWFRTLFPNDYYDYNAGELMSVAPTGFTVDGTSYALSDLTLRGIPMLDSDNNLYYDGDVYASDGTVTRNYATRAYEDGDETDGSTMITDGTNTVYALETATTETADAYTEKVTVADGGTEAFVDERTIPIPVGNESHYAGEYAINGWSECTITRNDGTEGSQEVEYTIDLDGTIYGGSLNATTGVLTVTMENIASYNGETINEPWLSSMDVYSAGATPTTGAQVVYTLSEPTTVQLTPTAIQMLEGNNTLWADTGDITVTYKAES